MLVILGPTASGKSDLAVALAKNFNGEVISADSRQVYRKMDIGTGKVPRDKISNSKFLISKQTPSPKSQISKQSYLYRGIQHHLLDVASPKRKFTVAQYQKMALKKIREIHKRNKLPILCGGTGFYIQSVVDGIVIPKIPPDWKLRKKLEKKLPNQLYQMLKKLDPRRAKIIDKKNPRRLIRAIEIVLKSKKPVPVIKKSQLFDLLIIGIKKEKKELKNLIRKRLYKRLNQGMIKEVRALRKDGVSWKRLEEFGLEYRYIACYLQKKIGYDEMVGMLQKAIESYAKRQITWFKKDKRVNWVGDKKKARKIINTFLTKQGGSRREPHPVSSARKQGCASKNSLDQRNSFFQRSGAQNDRKKRPEAIRIALLDEQKPLRLFVRQ